MDFGITTNTEIFMLGFGIGAAFGFAFSVGMLEIALKKCRTWIYIKPKKRSK